MIELRYYSYIIRTVVLSLVVLFSCSAFGAGAGVGDSVVVDQPETENEKIEEDVHKVEKDARKFGKTTGTIVEKTLGKNTTAIVEKTYYSTMDFVTGKLKNYLDSSGIKGTDPTYVALPKRKWRVSLVGDMDNMSCNVNSNIDKTTPNAAGGERSAWDFELKIRPPVSASTGVWVGYMGYGFGISYLKTGQSNTNFSMNMASPNYSINVRWIHYNKDHELHDWYNRGYSYTDLLKNDNYSFDIASIVFDAYWIFNKKKFSLSAAYDMSTIQLRSAGSFIAGIVYNYQKCDYAVPDNVSLLMDANGIGKVKTYQGSISGGYTYNWVPTPGLVINLTGMPVLTLYNHTRLYLYDWQIITEGNGSGKVIGVKTDLKDSHSENGKIALNVNARIAAAYRYKNFVFSFMAQAYYMRSYLHETSFKVFQWTMKASAGIAL